MFKFVYTMSCKDSNGVDRDFQHTAYFSDSYRNTRDSALDLLNHWLLTWTGCECPNGGIYRYHTTLHQQRTNMSASFVRNPEPFISHWYGPKQHNHEMTEAVQK